MNQLWPWLPLVIIGIWCMRQIWKAKTKTEKSNYYLLQFMPNALLTAGVLGTFIGIALGLITFDLDNIDSSIADLLEGLKGAFWTSIVGMISSLFVNGYVKSLLFKKGSELKVPESDEVKAIKAFHAEMQQLAEKSMAVQMESTTLLTEKLGGFVDQIAQTNSTSMQELVSSLDRKTDEIVRTMRSNSELMVARFDDFARLLAQANVEALKTSFEELVSQFNETFQSLISSLVEQNFQELTASVEQLNEWQRQNKEDLETTYDIIDALLKGSNELIEKVDQSTTFVLENLETSALSLNGITESTSRLMDNESELVRLVNVLKTVMIDDARFIEITSNLSATSNALAKTTHQLENTADTLEDTTNSLSGLEALHAQLTHSSQELLGKLSAAQSHFNNIDMELSSIANSTGCLLGSGSDLVRIVNDLNSIASDEQNNFKSMVDALANATREFEAEKRMISDWLKREQGIHGAMVNYTEGLLKFTKALEAFDKIKDYDLNVFNKTFEKNLEKGLLDTFTQFDRLLKEYVRFLESDGSRRTITLELQSVNR